MDEEERKKEMDAFWDIDSLLPKKKQEPVSLRNTKESISLTEVTVGSDADQTMENRHFIPPYTAEQFKNPPKPDEEYTTENTLISSVQLFRIKSDYPYYEKFVQSAVRLYRVHGVKCEYAPFFSYVPQYSQMQRPQLLWYLWWRENFRAGVLIESTYSYVLLYIYELLNLPEVVDPSEIRDQLAEVWISYRELYRQLDSKLPEWICDFCLIHQLPAPQALLKASLTNAMSHCLLKEFFVPLGDTSGYIRALLSFCTSYDYRKSKFYNEENRELYDRVIPGALSNLFEELKKSGSDLSRIDLQNCSMTRISFQDALCAYRFKRKIKVEYASFSLNSDLRALVTDAIKYTENRLRTVLSVRSKLVINSLPDEAREILNCYLDRVAPTRQSRSFFEKICEYEKNYDLPKHEFSIQTAEEIEKSSWDMTEKLVEAFQDPPQPKEEEILAPTIAEDCRKADDLSDFFPLLQGFLEKDQAKIKEAVGKAGKTLDVLVDEINEYFFDQYGDILILDDGDGYEVLLDYRELLNSILKTNERTMKHGKN